MEAYWTRIIDGDLDKPGNYSSDYEGTIPLTELPGVPGVGDVVYPASGVSAGPESGTSLADWFAGSAPIDGGTFFGRIDAYTINGGTFHGSAYADIYGGDFYGLVSGPLYGGIIHPSGHAETNLWQPTCEIRGSIDYVGQWMYAPTSLAVVDPGRVLAGHANLGHPGTLTLPPSEKVMAGEIYGEGGNESTGTMPTENFWGRGFRGLWF